MEQGGRLDERWFGVPGQVSLFLGRLQNLVLISVPQYVKQIGKAEENDGSRNKEDFKRPYGVKAGSHSVKSINEREVTSRCEKSKDVLFKFLVVNKMAPR